MTTTPRNWGATLPTRRPGGATVVVPRSPDRRGPLSFGSSVELVFHFRQRGSIIPCRPPPMQPPLAAEPTESAMTETPARGARTVLALLILVSMFNYIDRQVLAAVLPKIELEPAFDFVGNKDPKFWKNLLATAFLVSYMVTAPLFGWLGDRMGRRWGLVGLAIIFWSLVSGGSGLAVSYNMLFLTRCLIAVGEGAYGPVGTALLTDVYPPAKRGWVISLVMATIPVGSALGYALGTLVADSPLGWRWAFYLVVPPGVLLG